MRCLMIVSPLAGDNLHEFVFQIAMETGIRFWLSIIEAIWPFAHIIIAARCDFQLNYP